MLRAISMASLAEGPAVEAIKPEFSPHSAVAAPSSALDGGGKAAPVLDQMPRSQEAPVGPPGGGKVAAACGRATAFDATCPFVRQAAIDRGQGGARPGVPQKGRSANKPNLAPNKAVQSRR